MYPPPIFKKRVFSSFVYLSCFWFFLMIVDLGFVKLLTTAFLLSPFFCCLYSTIRLHLLFLYRINHFLFAFSFVLSFFYYTAFPRRFHQLMYSFLPSLLHFSLSFWNLRCLSQSVPPTISHNYSNHFLLILMTLYPFPCLGHSLVFFRLSLCLVRFKLIRPPVV